METPVFELNKQRYPVKLTMKDVLGVLQDYELDLFSIFASEETMQNAMMNLLLNDQMALDLMYLFIERKNKELTKDQVLELMEDMSILDNFREAFWAAVVNFSSPLKKELLRGIWETLKKELRDKNFARRMLEELSSNGNAETPEQ